MWNWLKVEKPKQAEVVPDTTFTAKSLRDCWWHIFKMLIEMSIDDPEALMGMQANAKRAAAGARALADAAIDEFEDRWGASRDAP